MFLSLTISPILHRMRECGRPAAGAKGETKTFSRVECPGQRQGWMVLCGHTLAWLELPSYWKLDWSWSSPRAECLLVLYLLTRPDLL